MEKQLKDKQMKRFYLGILLSLFTIVNAQAQWHYARSYDDFMQSKWVQLDTIFMKHHGKSSKQGKSNNFTLTTGDKKTDKLLEKEAFAIAKGDTVFLNCRKLSFDNMSFGKGYTPARRIGYKSLLFANGLIDKENFNGTVVAFGVKFGAIGGALAAATLDSNKNDKHQVCYLISQGGNENGTVNVRLLDDTMVERMLEGHNDLIYEYITEEGDTERMNAARVVPLLEKAGLFDQWKTAQ